MKYISVVNLEKYQHYQSGRSTIWIKWYFKCLRDYKFQQLNNSQRWLFVGIVMMAVECSNSVPMDVLHVRDTVCYKSPNSVQRVREGLAKMLKLGLITTKNAIIEKIREEKIREEDFSKSPLKDERTINPEGLKKLSDLKAKMFPKSSLYGGLKN